MAEYIDREVALMKLMQDGCSAKNLQSISDMPAADVAPVMHGRWIKESDGGTRCSVCNKRVRNVTGGWYEPVDLSDMPYCPKCGAKMDETVEENKE